MKRILSLALALLTLASAVALAVPASASSPFSDVAESRWSFDAIKYVYGRKYMEGVGGGKFSPAGTVTRAMAVTVLFRKEGSPAPAAPSGFSDVKDGTWYSNAVAWAKENGVVNGVGGGRFDPDGEITREQLAAVLYRYTALKGYDTLLCGDTDRFPDAAEVDGYASDPMNWAVGKGLVSGVRTDRGDLLVPRGNATREQFAAILQRFDSTYPVRYSNPVVKSEYTEKPYPLVDGADVYVAPDGDDGAAGDFDHPVATFGRAVELVRGLKETVTDRSVVVAFKAGKYLADNVTMTAADSGTKEHPVIYCGYGDGEAVITGGVVISENDFVPVDPEHANWFNANAVGKIKKYDLGEILPGYSEKDFIFSENGVLWLARYPNKYVDKTDCLLKGFGKTVSDHVIRIGHPMLTKRVIGNVYHTTRGLKLYGYLTTGWYKDTLDTDSFTVDAESGGVDFHIPNPETARMGSLRYGEFPWEEYQATCFLNMSEDLDDKGEYWVDPETLTLYVYDPQGDYTIPVRDNGLILQGCDYVTFRGLTVKGYRKSLFQASGICGLTLDRCRFSVCSEQIAMTVYGRGDADFDTKITECDFSVFAGRVLVVSGPCGTANMFTRKGDFLFDNNRVSLTNLNIEWNAAVTVAGCNAAVLSHNEFEDCSYMAITYGGCNNIIEYNVFRHCVFNSQDCGIIYCGNSQSDWGNVIRYNIFYPIIGDTFGIYLDDDEPGAEIYGNLFFDATVCIHDGRSNNIHDNIMLWTGVASSVGAMSEVIERYNASGDPGEVLNDSRANSFYTRWKNFFSVLDSDPALKEQYFEKYPELASLTVDLDRTGDDNFVLFPRNYVRNNWMFKMNTVDVNPVEEYCAFEGNRLFSFSDNPCFVNPTAGDYSVVPGTGAPDVRFGMIGRY